MVWGAFGRPGALRGAFPTFYVRIMGNHKNHENHKNYDGGGHFQAVIISDDFEGLSLLDRHKKIYAILGDLMKNEIHAFSMKTYTNNEFKALNE